MTIILEPLVERVKGTCKDSLRGLFYSRDNLTLSAESLVGVKVDSGHLKVFKLSGMMLLILNDGNC